MGAAAAGLAVAAGGHAWSAEPQGPRRAPAAPDENASLNVRWFGARGDGTTDDTAAIQKALDAAGRQRGNVVLLPTGDYRADGTEAGYANPVAQDARLVPRQGEY